MNKVLLILFIFYGYIFSNSNYVSFMDRHGYSAFSITDIYIFEPENTIASTPYHLTKSLLVTEYFFEKIDSNIEFNYIFYYINSNETIKFNKDWFLDFIKKEDNDKYIKIDDLLRKIDEKRERRRKE